MNDELLKIVQEMGFKPTEVIMLLLILAKIEDVKKELLSEIKSWMIQASGNGII